MMFKKSVKAWEKEIEKLKAEIADHERKRSKAKPEDRPVHAIRKKAAEEALSKAKGKLLIARAEEAIKKKKK